MSDIALDFRPAARHPLAAIIAIWERVLRFSPIQAEDDFFELGGDSLLALNLFHEIEKTTGRALPIATIYDAATPAAQVALLDGGVASRFSPLVKLKDGDERAPLFILHGIGGHVMELQELGEALDTPRAVYAIQARGVDGDDRPFDRIEDMAHYDLAAIRELQPNGPYFLAGYSFGGLIALEIARRLRAEGEHVPFLGFIDSYAHPQTFPKLVRFGMRLRLVADLLRSTPTRDALRFILARLTHRKPSGSRFAEIVAPDLPTAVNATLQRVYDAAYAGLLRYCPTYYAGRIDFFQSEISLVPVNPAHIWRKLSRDFARHILPGTHGSIMHENVAYLAGALSNRLRHPEHP